MHYLYCTFIEFKTKIKIEIGGDNNENFELNNKQTIPAVGFGVFMIPNEDLLTKHI